MVIILIQKLSLLYAYYTVKCPRKHETYVDYSEVQAVHAFCGVFVLRLSNYAATGPVLELLVV
jgi:hypothetical protein